jgi:hypothetical protein
MAINRSTRLLLIAACVSLLTACAGTQDGRANGFGESWSARNQAALVEANLMPQPAAYEIKYFQWVDRDRQREVMAKLYLPPAASRHESVPLIAFSHGMGGSREGYSYLGANWAARGYASLHVQHAGSDSRLWSGNPLDMVSRLQSAANETEAVNRVRDLGFALDAVLADPQFAGVIDPDTNPRCRPLLRRQYRLARRRRGILAPAGEPHLPRQPHPRRRHHQRAPLSRRDPTRRPSCAQSASRRCTSRQQATKSGFPATSPTTRTACAFSPQPAARAKPLWPFATARTACSPTDLGAGGRDLNPLVKAATIDLTLAFFEEILGGTKGLLALRTAAYENLLARFESEPRSSVTLEHID